MTSVLGDFPPAGAEIACAGVRHRIRWQSGDLVATAHEDPEGERALSALGGKRVPCIDILDAWARCRRDPRLLTVLSRGPGDALAVATDRPVRLPGRGRVFPRRSGGWVGRSRAMTSAVSFSAGAAGSGRAMGRPIPPQGQQRDRFQEDANLLAGLGRHIGMRLVATVTTGLVEGLGMGDPAAVKAQPSLEASLVGRSGWVIRNWLGSVDDEIIVNVVGAGEEKLSRTVDGAVCVDLPLQWVSELWGRDLGIVGDRFSLALLEVSGRKMKLLTVDPDFTDPPKMVTVDLTVISRRGS